MDIYQDLGLKKVVNCAGTYTVVGATRMSDETLQAMQSAASSFVDIETLHKTLNRKVAELTNNEAAYICNSCSTAIYLIAAAFVSKKYGKPFKYIADEDVRKCEMVGIWSQHIPYDHAISQLGVKMKFIGYTNPQSVITEEDVRMAINENTVGVYFAPRTPRGYYGEKSMNLDKFIEIAHSCGVPVLVDAAAQLPPKSNLWEFTQMGADIVTFSGGKDLAGPQASGLAVGKKEICDILEESGFPNYGPGRLMKIGREEMVALYSAVKQYMENDEEARLNWCESEVVKLRELLAGSKMYSVLRCWPNQAGQPLPRSFVEMDSNKTAELVRAKLSECNPSVFCFTENQNGIYINPMCMKEGDTEYVAQKLLEIEAEITK